MPWVSADRWEEPELSLGWLIADWAEAYLRVPGGAMYGEPLVLTGWQLRALADWYAIGPDRRFLFRRGQIRMAKGTGKSPFAAVVACAELCGPVVFDGVDAQGDPVGKSRAAPLVQVAAVSEDQGGNTYGAFHAMLAESPLLDEAGIDLGVTRTVLRGRPGRLEVVTASAGSREGQPITACVPDEALALDTPLPTPTGWTTMGAVRPGDFLLGADGMPVEVLKATDVLDDRDCYRVTFDDGSSVVASAGHMWLAWRSGRKRNARVVTTQQMVDNPGRWLIPIPAAWELPEADLPIDPYLLGAWLGDGDSRNATISGGVDDLPDIEREIASRGYTVKRCATRPDRCALTYVSVPGSHRNRHSPVKGVKVRLRELGLIGNKHIPDAYLFGSIDQRMDLLRGLMDTDGHVSRSGHCTFVGTERLTADLVSLLGSLGQTCSRIWCPDERSRHGGYYKVHFTARDGLAPFTMRRKADLVKQNARGAGAGVRSIEPVASVPVRCVAVASPDRLFLAGASGRVTHNTHLWTRSNGGRRLYATLLRNASKMGARLLATTNAWVPGDESVAEQVELAAAKAPGIMVYGPQYEAHVEDLTDVDALRRGLGRTYTDSPWVDQDRILVDCQDPDMTAEDVHRFHLNRPAAADSVLCATPISDPAELEAGAPVAVGFDGSRTRDATAVVAVHMLTGVAYLLGYWERPLGLSKRDRWEVPRGEVVSLVDAAFSRFRVERVKADPSHWQDELAGWQQSHGRDVVDRFPVWQSSVVDQATEAAQTALASGGLRLSAGRESEVLVAHVQRASVVRRQVGSRTLRSLAKPDEGGRIDCAAALTYAWQARLELLGKGWTGVVEESAEPFVLFG